MSSWIYAILFGLVLLTVFFVLKHRLAANESFLSEGALLGSPVMWWIVDDETNSRNWWDFGARNSHLPNRGYLELALECARRTQGSQFAIQPLLGRQAVSDVLKNAGAKIPDKIESVPVSIWRQWAVANLCAVKGGLAVCGDCTLFIGPALYPSVSSTAAAVFGIYSDEPRALPGSDTAPSPWMGWATQAHHPGWDVAASAWNKIIGAGPTAWTAADARRENLNIWNFQKVKGVSHLQALEGGRNADGYEKTLEDLFAREAEPADPNTRISPGTVYVPMDGDKLVRMSRYSWFVRMSKSQILESKFVWADFAHKVLIGPANL